MEVSEIKKKLGYEAVNKLVKDGMKIGLGTGSTAMYAVRWVMEKRIQGELKHIIVVPTSLQTEMECIKYNIPYRSLNDPEVNAQLDLTIDGADEIDPDWNLIKGGGGALVLEKIVGISSSHYAVIGSSKKIVKYLGETHSIPVEVMPSAFVLVKRILESLHAAVTIRMAKEIAGPVITKQGNMLFDISFQESFVPAEMEKKLNSIPGVIDNGIFTLHVTDVFIGYPDGRVEHQHRD